MSPKKNPPIPAETPEAQSELENLDQLMSEIDQLQAEINDTSASSPAAEAPKLRVVASNPAPAEAAAEAAFGSTTETDIMEEFRAGGTGSEANLASTLADLGDAPAEGGGILDQILADETTQSLEREHVASLAPETHRETYEAEPAATEPSMAEEEPTMSNQSPSSKDGSLTMTLQGSMTLNLQYECDGQAVSVAFENGFLKVTLADGTEFKVPVARTRAVRKVA